MPEVIPGGAEAFRASMAFVRLKSHVPTIDDLLQETGALIAGGGILCCLTPEKWLSNDLDLYVPCRHLPAFLTAFNTFRTNKEFKASEYCPSFLRRNGIRTVKTMRGIEVDDEVGQLNIYVDLMAVRHKTSPLNVVQNFDLTACQVWYDGKDVYATHPDHISMMKATLQGDYVPVFSLGNRFLQNRIQKYNDRGFEITIDQTILRPNSYWSVKHSMNNNDSCSEQKPLSDDQKGVRWARKMLFRTALGTQEHAFLRRKGQRYVKEEEGYDSEDYVETPEKILELQPKEAMSEKGYAFLRELMDEDGYLIRGRREILGNMIPNWETDYLDPFKAELEALVGPPEEPTVPLWKGFTKKDIEFLDVVFGESTHANTLAIPNPDEVLYSMCPICLRYISHETATCMYMTHDCKEMRGYYHKELYEAYKFRKVDFAGRLTNKEVICWCTICGRICGDHRHYTLRKHNEEGVLVNVAGAPYESDCRRTSGGGGPPEKIARFNALRNQAYELNQMIGELPEEEAKNVLVEAMWDGPLTKPTTKYNISTGTFPNNVSRPTVYPNIPYPNVRNPDLMPIVHKEATEEFTNHYDVDDKHIVQFRHKRADGTINNHTGDGNQISKSMLLNYINSLADQKGTEKYGMCWQYPTCTARMYPEEILAIVDQENEEEMKTYQQYKDGFNEQFYVARGGKRRTRRQKRRM
jgi:hypothetical protein